MQHILVNKLPSFQTKAKLFLLKLFLCAWRKGQTALPSQYLYRIWNKQVCLENVSFVSFSALGSFWWPLLVQLSEDKHLLKLVAFWGPRPALGRSREARRSPPASEGEALLARRASGPPGPVTDIHQPSVKCAEDAPWFCVSWHDSHSSGRMQSATRACQWYGHGHTLVPVPILSAFLCNVTKLW